MPRRKKYTQLSFDGVPEIQNLENNEVTTIMEMKHLVFGISRSSSDLEGGPKAASNIEKFIKENYFDNGWKLFKMFYMGSDPEYFQFLYVLTREQ